jgi:hypothetical protein
MQLVRGGRAPAFELISERHCQAAFSLAYRMTGSLGLAEDVAQEAVPQHPALGPSSRPGRRSSPPRALDLPDNCGC